VSEDATPPSQPPERTAKSPTAFRTISEVADELGVQPHVLRFWESKFPQVRPLKRAGGRRYYRPDDIEALRTIKSLLHEQGYTIKGAQKLLRARRRTAAGSAETAPEPAAEAEQLDALRRERLARIARELRRSAQALRRLLAG
jgi:DNA-binding transcriptional MerR regulator